MKPLAQYSRHRQTGMNFRKDVILHIVDGHLCTVQWVLNYCINIGLASQATIHRELHELIDDKYITAKRSKQDSRIVDLSVAKKGHLYLEVL